MTAIAYRRTITIVLFNMFANYCEEWAKLSHDPAFALPYQETWMVSSFLVYILYILL